jgi:hypothetical protein
VTDAKIAKARQWVHDLIRDAGGRNKLPITTITACDLVMELTADLQLARFKLAGRLPRIVKEKAHA